MARGGIAARVLGSSVVFGLAIGMAGCDYWPPALQTQIEQLQSEMQTLTAEKGLLQAQLASVSKAKEELQAQVDELGRVNRKKTVMIANLQDTVAKLQQRVAKSAKPVSKKAKTSKSAPKSSTKKKKKSPAKKKPSAKSSTVR